MRAIIINAKDRTISETDIDGSLKSLQHIVGGMIEVVTQGLDNNHHFAPSFRRISYAAT